MVVFVECGDQVYAGSALNKFYNFWLNLIYMPMFAFGMMVPQFFLLSFLYYGPVIFFVLWLWHQLLRNARSKGLDV